MFKSWVIVAFGVLIASNTASGIHYDSREALIIVVILLSACNVFLKPLLMLFSLPFIILTFGIGIWVINALLFLFVAALVSGFVDFCEYINTVLGDPGYVTDPVHTQCVPGCSVDHTHRTIIGFTNQPANAQRHYDTAHSKELEPRSSQRGSRTGK